MQIWVPDMRRPDFETECLWQSRVVTEADRRDPDLAAFFDAALANLEGSGA